MAIITPWLWRSKTFWNTQDAWKTHVYDSVQQQQQQNTLRKNNLSAL
jgi:hypothetical protein